MWILTLFAATIFLWFVYRKACFSVLKKMGVPGPEPNILFGNMLEMFRKTPLKCQKEWFEKYGNVVGYYLGTKPIVSVADVEMLKKIQVSDFRKFINRPNLNIGRSDRPTENGSKLEGFDQQLIYLRDKKWKEIRSITTPAFTASKMKQLVPMMNDAIDSFLDNVQKKCSADEPFDIYPLYQGLSVDIIGRAAFGIQTISQNNLNDSLLRTARFLFSVDIQDHITLLAYSFRFLNVIWKFLNKIILRFKNKGMNPTNQLIQSIKEVISMRRKNKENRGLDLLQLLIESEIDDFTTLMSKDLRVTGDGNSNEKAVKNSSTLRPVLRMTDAEILDNSVLFFLAGFETISLALSFTTHFLVQHPKVQEKVRQEVEQLLDTEGQLDYSSVCKLKYLDQVLNESLRLYPPAYLFIKRECGEDIEFGNMKLKKGTTVEVPAFYIHRNPDFWGPNVNEFLPERFSPENKSKIHPMAFQAFSQGPRNCVGMRFACLETKLALARLLSKYKIIPCHKTEGDPLTLRCSLSAIRPLLGIWTKVVPVLRI